MNVNTTSAPNLAHTDMRAEPPAAPMLEPTIMPRTMLPTLELPTSAFRRSPDTVHSLLTTPDTAQATEEVERVAISVGYVLFLKTNSKPVNTNEDSPTGWG